MRFLTLVAALSLAFAAGCDRNATPTPSPKTDSTSSLPSSAAGSTTSSSKAGTPTTSEKREGANPQQGQVDPKSSAQQRDFQHSGDQAGPKSPDAAPTTK